MQGGIAWTRRAVRTRASGSPAGWPAGSRGPGGLGAVPGSTRRQACGAALRAPAARSLGGAAGPGQSAAHIRVLVRLQQLQPALARGAVHRRLRQGRRVRAGSSWQRPPASSEGCTLACRGVPCNRLAPLSSTHAAAARAHLAPAHRPDQVGVAGAGPVERAAEDGQAAAAVVLDQPAGAGGQGRLVRRAAGWSGAARGAERPPWPGSHAARRWRAGFMRRVPVPLRATGYLRALGDEACFRLAPLLCLLRHIYAPIAQRARRPVPQRLFCRRGYLCRAAIDGSAKHAARRTSSCYG